MRHTIRVLAAPADVTEHKSLTDRAAKAVLANVETDKLKASLKDLRRDVAELFNTGVDESGFALAQVSVGVEISAEGGVNLIGTLTAGAKAAVTLTFQRR